MKKTFNFLMGIALLCLAHVSYAQTQLSNAGFETWTGSPSHPTGWATLESATGSSGNLATKDVSTFSQGTASIKLRTDSFNVVGVGKFLAQAEVWTGTGVLVTVPQPDIKYFGIPFTSRPDSVTFMYRSIPLNGDSGNFRLNLTRWNGSMQDKVGENNGSSGWLMNTSGVWTRRSHPVNYYLSAIPDTLFLRFQSSAMQQQTIGSSFWIDDVKLIYNTVGMYEGKSIRAELYLYPNPATEVLHFDTASDLKGCKVEVFDAMGKLVLHSVLDNNSLSVSSLAKGNYTIRISNKSGEQHDGKFTLTN